MERPFDLIVRGGTCVLHGGLAQVDLGISGGRICAVGELAGAPAELELDARHLHVLPGAIDTQVHFREPGFEPKETLASGSHGAALGGVTAVFELPDARPPTTSAAALEDKLSRARAGARCDFAFFLAATPDNLDDLDRLERLPGCSGLTVALSGQPHALLLEGDEPLYRALSRGARRVTVRCEDEARARVPLAESGAAVDLHPRWRDDEAAARATQRLLHLAKRAGRRVHLQHGGAGEELALAAQHRDIATVACTARDLTLGDADATGALWRAVRGGLVDAVGSDHGAPTPEERQRGAAGAPGVQALLPVMLEHVHAGRLGLPHLAELLSAGPARIYNVARKGRIAVGFDADLALVDLAAERTIEARGLPWGAGSTPFEGLRVHGWPVATLLRGEVVARDGRLVGDGPTGAPVRFSDTLRMVVL